MQNSLRVLHVIPSVSPLRGGPSKAIIEMVDALRRSGIDAEIATTNDDGPDLLNVPLNERITHQGVPVYFFKRSSPPLGAIREFAYSLGFQRWLKQNIDNYDVIHVHAIFSFCSTYAMRLANKRNIPYVVRPIGQLETWALEQSKGRKARYLSLIEKENLRHASKIHFTADSEQTQALELIPELDGCVIPLGLEVPMPITQAKRKIEQRWDLQRGVPTIVYLSRLHPKKGLELLLEALSKMQEIPFQLVIAGDGDEDFKQQLQTLVDQLGLGDRCLFIGFVQGTEKNLLLQGADLFALTSHSENFGIAVLEAMASGTTVLVSEEVALSEQVAKNKLGYVTELFEPSIRMALLEALSDIEATQEQGQAARSFVEKHYQWSNIANQLGSLYRSLVAQAQ